MNLDDILYTGSRPTTLRIVLGLTEDAENSLETYRWAVPALMHSYDTEDKELFDYIQEVFKRKELSPYKPYNKKEKPETSDEKLIRKMVMNEHVMRSKAKMALEELMSLKDAKGDKLFCQKNHWWVVFRLFIDHQVGNVHENRYKEFMELIASLNLISVNAELDMTTLSNISQDIYRYPYIKWQLKIPREVSSRWMSAYTRMCQIAEKLEEILKEKGF